MAQGLFDLGTYVDRELGWLDFNARVVSLAQNSKIPLAERLRFLSISSTNFDDFYMIRVANVKNSFVLGNSSKNTAGLTPHELLKKIFDKTQEIIDRQKQLLYDEILPEMSREGIHFINFEQMTAEEKMHVGSYFQNMIYPILTPLVVDPSHPFPYISGLSLNLAISLQAETTDEKFFARVKVPPLVPRLYEIHRKGEQYFLPIEDIISHHLFELFPGAKITDSFVFRVTRNQDLDLDEEDSVNLLESIEQEISQRKFGPPVRLEVPKNANVHLLKTLIHELEIEDKDVIRHHGILDISGLNQIIDALKPKHRYPRYEKLVPANLNDFDETKPEKFFSKLLKNEVLLHHPYDSFNKTVVRFLQISASDSQVLAIKQTLYRTSGDSPIVDALIEAAENGKQVLAVIELRARFDELANVRWARKLESAGVHVVYGLMGLKTHAKLSLVVRQEGSELVRYCHIGTGNYNPKTAEIYEDYGLMSADKNLGQDLSKIFNQLSGFVVETKFKRLLVAPRTLRMSLMEKIDREIRNSKNGKKAKLQFKLNALIDESFVAKLYEASHAGVEVKLIIRGASSIVPGIPQISENIRVRSIVGRFLEHSRIYYFYNDNKPEIFVGSADLMERNLDRRVEALVNISDQEHIDRIIQEIESYWRDDIHCFEMQNDSTWSELNIDGKFLHSEKLIALKNKL